MSEETTQDLTPENDLSSELVDERIEEAFEPIDPISESATADHDEIRAIVGGYHGTPYRVLGPHTIDVEGKERLVIRAFRPLDEQVFVVEIKSGKRTPMERVHPLGFFEAVFPRRRNPFPYRLIVADAEGNEYELEDPYRFPLQLTEFEIYLHGEGNYTESYTKLGAHFTTIDEVGGVSFAVWAPNAQRIGVIGPFNGWDNRVHPMERRTDSDIWELFIPNLVEGTPYKFAIKSLVMGYEVDKSDPYAYYADMRPGTESRIWDIQQICLGRRPVDGRAARSPGVGPADQYLRGPPGQLEACAGDQRLPQLPGSGPRHGRLLQ